MKHKDDEASDLTSTEESLCLSGSTHVGTDVTGKNSMTQACDNEHDGCNKESWCDFATCDKSGPWQLRLTGNCIFTSVEHTSIGSPRHYACRGGDCTPNLAGAHYACPRGLLGFRGRCLAQRLCSKGAATCICPADTRCTDRLCLPISVNAPARLRPTEDKTTTSPAIVSSSPSCSTSYSCLTRRENCYCEGCKGCGPWEICMNNTCVRPCVESTTGGCPADCFYVSRGSVKLCQDTNVKQNCVCDEHFRCRCPVGIRCKKDFCPPSLRRRQVNIQPSDLTGKDGESTTALVESGFLLTQWMPLRLTNMAESLLSLLSSSQDSGSEGPTNSLPVNTTPQTAPFRKDEEDGGTGSAATATKTESTQRPAKLIETEVLTSRQSYKSTQNFEVGFGFHPIKPITTDTRENLQD